jgi:glycosyltransferase involved in cell wall biosynthesis
MRIVFDLQGCQTLSRQRGIGRYSSGLAVAMVRDAGPHEVWLALNGSFPETIPEIRRTFGGLVPKDRIRTFEIPHPVGQLFRENAWRVHAAEILREEFLHRIQADVILLSSLFEGLADDAVTSVGRLYDGGRTAVTLYDLTMLAMPQQFLTNERWRSWYYRKLQSLKNAGLLLGISQFSCDEAVARLGVSEDRVVNMSSAVDARFKRLTISPNREGELQQRYGFRKPFLMTVGAADPNKNLEGLIRAFGLLPPNLRNSHQLVIVFELTEDNRERWLGVTRRAGLNPDQVVFTGRVRDEDLVELYNLAALYVMPSFMEGFGLPAVEAMACGAPAIGSNRASVPEAIGRSDALFDPFQPESMAKKISQVLTDDGFRRSLVEHGERHAKSFCWDNTARTAISALEALDARQARRRSAVAVRAFKPRLAVAAPARAPWRERENLLSELACFYEVELVCDEPVEESPWIATSFPRRSTAWFDENAERFDRLIYLFEYEEIDLSQLELLCRRPGTAILHKPARVSSAALRESSDVSEATLPRLAYWAGGYAALVRLKREGSARGLAGRYAREIVLERAGGVIFLGNSEFEKGHGPTTDQTLCAHIPTRSRLTVHNGDALAGSAFDARLVYEAIERFAAHHPKLRRMAILQRIAEISRDVAPTDHDLEKIANALARQEPNHQRTIYLDISLFALNDNKSGIHRVVRNIVRELATDPPQGIRVETVRERDGAFWTARAATFSLLGVSSPFAEESVVEFKQGDILLGLDLIAHRLPPLRQLLTQLRGRGVDMWFLLYDLLPLQRPEWFPPEITSWFEPWLDTVLECADGIICISRVVAFELEQVLETRRPGNGNRPRIDCIHLGAEVRSSASDEGGLPEDGEAVLQVLANRPSFLMVGTLEPRKGHEITLNAFERLWKDGVDVNLVVAGPQGWKVEALVEKLTSHSELGRRLFWLGHVSDAYLNKLYSVSVALIAASRGEGFGLPIVEAALHGKPVLATDIPVFREVAGAMASVLFFPVDSPEGLAEAVCEWFKRNTKSECHAAETGRWITWADSARQLCRVVLGAAGREQGHGLAPARTSGEGSPERISSALNRIA